MMSTLRDDIAELRRDLWLIAAALPTHGQQVIRLLDFHDKAVAALETVECDLDCWNDYRGDEHSPTCIVTKCKGVLALLDKEIS